jgi:NAD(P)H-dependent FMN reductase
MRKILAFAGSTSSISINKKLAIFAAENLKNTAFDSIDLRDFEMSMYSTDEEKKGFPEQAKRFTALLEEYDGFILSLAEHNGSYTAAFKNIFDWSSRIEANVFRDKPVLLMSTSPGAMGGRFVLEAGIQKFSRMGAKKINSFSLPNFEERFKEGKLIDITLLKLLSEQITEFEKEVNA